MATRDAKKEGYRRCIAKVARQNATWYDRQMERYGRELRRQFGPSAQISRFASKAWEAIAGPVKK